MLLDLARENQQVFASRADRTNDVPDISISLARFYKSDGDLALARTIELNRDYALPRSKYQRALSASSPTDVSIIADRISGTCSGSWGWR